MKLQYRTPPPTLFVAIALIFTFLPALAAAQAQSWAEGRASAVSMNELIPRLSSGQAYTERYTFAVDLDDGTHVGFNFTISNLGVRSGYGASEVRVRFPDRANYHHQERVSRRNWSHQTDRFALDIADTQVEAEGANVFVLRHTSDEIEVELRFQNRIPMWRPGNGEIRNGDDYYRFMLTAPRADVTGRIKVDGAWREVRGSRSGYGDHVATNVAPYDLAKRFTRFRHYNDDIFVMWREIELTEDHGGHTVAFVVVAVGDRIIYEDVNPEVRFSGLQLDGATGYHVPHQADVISSNGSVQLRFSLRGDSVEKRDLLASYGRAARLVASRLSNPFQYNITGSYNLEIAGGTSIRRSGKGHFTVDFVNP